jgi:hypothetical protein
MRGELHDSVDKAIRNRVRDAFLLFELVLKVNLAPMDAGELEALGLGLLAYQMRSFDVEAEVEECRDFP